MERGYWDEVARKMSMRYHLDPLMAEQKRKVHLDLLREWCPSPAGLRILKTDLFEEAFGADEILLGWPSPETNVETVGTDISFEITRQAKTRLLAGGRAVRTATADVRSLPFPDRLFDLVFSCSTLDHFSGTVDLIRGLEESVRLLKPGGELILLLDNPRAFFYPLVRLVSRRGGIDFHLGKTLTLDRQHTELKRIGMEVIDERAVYHLPRIMVTAILRVIRATRIGWADRFIMNCFRRLERRQGRAGQYRSGWYTAIRAVKIAPVHDTQKGENR